MSKSKETQKDQKYLDNFQEMARKLAVMSQIACRQFLGSRPDKDPRLLYLGNMEAFKNLATVQLEVIMELTVGKLGISKEEYMKVHGEHLASRLSEMEKDLCITSWSPEGNPIFDLPAYAEATKSWPR